MYFSCGFKGIDVLSFYPLQSYLLKTPITPHFCNLPFSAASKEFNSLFNKGMDSECYDRLNMKNEDVLYATYSQNRAIQLFFCPENAVSFFKSHEKNVLDGVKYISIDTELVCAHRCSGDDHAAYITV